MQLNLEVIIEDLRNRAVVKSRFEEKYLNTPSEVQRKLSPSYMSRLAKKGTQGAYVEAARCLGFSRNITQPFLFGKKSVSVYDMARDYVRYYYEFDIRWEHLLNCCTQTGVLLKPYHEYYLHISQ